MSYWLLSHRTGRPAATSWWWGVADRRPAAADQCWLTEGQQQIIQSYSFGTKKWIFSFNLWIPPARAVHICLHDFVLVSRRPEKRHKHTRRNELLKYRHLIFLFFSLDKRGSSVLRPIHYLLFQKRVLYWTNKWTDYVFEIVHRKAACEQPSSDCWADCRH